VPVNEHAPFQFEEAGIIDLYAIAHIFHPCWQISYKYLLADQMQAEMDLDKAAAL